MSASVGAKSARVTFNPHNQNVETINALVASILNKSGCLKCGRLLNLAFEFQGDPGPDAAKMDVISLETEGI
jgi:hypothetical protein